MIDISGERFGKLTAIRRTGFDGRWLCHCDCGRDVEFRIGALRRQDKPAVSCGCVRVKKACPIGADLLKTLYWDRGMTLRDVGIYVRDLLNLAGIPGQAVVQRWLTENNIRLRTHSDMTAPKMEAIKNAQKLGAQDLWRRQCFRQYNRSLRGSKAASMRARKAVRARTKQSTKVEVKCSRPGCNKTVLRYQSDLRKVKHYSYCCKECKVVGQKFYSVYSDVHKSEALCKSPAYVVPEHMRDLATALGVEA